MEVPRQLAREIAQDCQETVLRFFAHIDAAEYREMEKYFADDGIWKRAAGDINGVKELRSVFAKRPPGLRTRHVVTNFVTTVISPECAAVQSYITGYRDEPAPGPDSASVTGARRVSSCTVLTCKDELVLAAGVWKIRSRQTIPDFVLEAG